MHAGFLWGNLRERDHLEYVGIDGRIIIKRIFKERGLKYEPNSPGSE